MESILKGLNATQRAAATSRASVLQCLAPPGSGKTKTLTSRVAYLVHNGYQPQNIICCTFTIKASREMRERLRGLIGNDLEKRLVLGTFHSICRRYLVTYGHLINIPNNFGIADSDDSLGIIKRLQKKIKFGLDPKAARNKISHRKARGERIDHILKTAGKSAEAREFALVFQEYETALATSNLLDYDDLLVKCVELLQKHPECVSNIEALLIDEFQDTNTIQFELMKLLASAKKRITIVGDPDQSIYGFRSAEIENLQRMRRAFPETEVINLEENYRSSSAILNLAQDVIEQDTDRPVKRLKSTHRYGTLPVLRRLYNPHEEADWIVSEVKRMTKLCGGAIEFSDIAILLRSAFLSLLIEKSLARDGIPYKMVGGRRFFDRVEVRILLDYLRVINHPDNNSAFLSIINTPARKVGEGTVAELTRAAESEKCSLWALAMRVLNGDKKLDKKLSKAAEQGLQELTGLIKKGREKLQTFEPASAPGKLIELVANGLQFQDYLKKQYPEDWEERWENVKELSLQATDVMLEALTADDQLPEVEGVKQAQIEGAQEILTRFLANVALSTEVQSDDENEPKSRITISTIHSAKGLEWPVVFIPACYEGSIPHSRAEDTNEERRLLYVAMTRAKTLLYMTFPTMQPRNGSESIMSQFLPGSLDSRLSEAGPAFTDQVLQDITTILGRPMPPQEELAKGLVSLQENESQYDDIHPLDGSSRRRVNGETDIDSFFNIQGQSFSEAVSSGSVFQQRSNFSTVAGFTTASHQMSVMPVQEPAAAVPEKPKLVRKTSVQPRIASFFGKPAANVSQKENIPTPIAQPQRVGNSQGSSLPSIPLQLATHRPGKNILMNPATSMKRPRPVLTDTSNVDHRVNKKPYTCFSSSPIKESFDDVHDAAEPVIHEAKPKYNTSMTKLHSANQQGNGFSSYASGMLNTLNRPAPRNSMTGANSAVKKTLGVRRSMNGWAARKNK